MSTLDLLKKTSSITAATAKALEDTVGDDDIITLDGDGATIDAAPAAEVAEEVETVETVQLTPADIKKLKLKEVNDLAAKLDAGSLPEDFDSQPLVAKKDILISLLTDEPADAPAAVVEKVVAPKTIAPKAEASVEVQGDFLALTVTQIENVKDAATAHKRIHDLGDRSARTDFELGGYLSVIQTKGWFGDHSTFKAFVEAETYLAYRKAMYLISIYTSLVEAEIPWLKVAHLGWTKLKDLVEVLTLENVDEWVAKAEGISYNQLKYEIESYLKAQAAPADAPTVPADSIVSTLAFKVHDDQKETISLALDKAMKLGSTDVKAVALEYIANDFLASSSKAPAKSAKAAEAAPLTAEAAAQAISAEDYFQALVNLAGLENRMVLAEALLTAFDATFPEIQLQVTFPAAA